MVGAALVSQISEGRVPSLDFLVQPSPSASRPATPATPPKAKIPRPANAFMLYRSWLIKTGKIPKHIEPRQQNISRIAGECWNLLPPHEKAYWHEKARKIMEEHKVKNPGYKFNPERKKQSRKNAAEGEAPGQDHPDRIRFIREKYVHIAGEAVPPPRPRKCRSRRTTASMHPPPAPSFPHTFAPPPGQPLNLSAPEIPRVASAPPTTPAFVAGSSSTPEYIIPMGNTPYPDYLAQCLAQVARQSNQGGELVSKSLSLSSRPACSLSV